MPVHVRSVALDDKMIRERKQSFERKKIQRYMLKADAISSHPYYRIQARSTAPGESRPSSVTSTAASQEDSTNEGARKSVV